MSSAIHDARNGDINLAFRTVGSGSSDLIFIQGNITNLDVSDIRFSERGTHKLKGVPGRWRI